MLSTILSQENLKCTFLSLQTLKFQNCIVERIGLKKQWVFTIFEQQWNHQMPIADIPGKVVCAAYGEYKYLWELRTF